MTARPFAQLESGSLETYLAEIQRLPALPAQEATEIYRRAAEGDIASRERIVLAHLSLVVRLAFRYSGYGLPMADLVSEGNLGLLRAAELFDPRHGLAFSTYAGVWIKQRIHRAITSQARAVRIPVWRSQRLRKLARLHEELNAELGRDTELTDLAGRLGIPPDAVERIAAERLTIESLAEAGDLPAGDPHPAQRLSGEELHEEIAACLQGLDDTELQIVARKFGLLNEEPESYREMAPRFGRSREWIRRMGEHALAKLKSSLKTAGSLPRALIASRKRKVADRLKKLSRESREVPAKLSVWNMALMQGLEPLIAIL